MVQRCKQGRQGIRCPTAQDRPYVVKNHILHEVPLLPTKYGGSREDNSNKTRNLRCYSNRAYGMNGTTLVCPRTVTSGHLATSGCN
ncbi:hypothetical protein ACLKA7_008773 [Drosophila subpalustris]